MKKISSTDFPTVINFFFVLLTLGAFGFYFLYKESKKNGFFLGNEEQSKMLLIIGAIIYCLATLVFNWLSLFDPINNGVLPNLLLYSVILSYSVIYIYGYFYLSYILEARSEEKSLSFLGLLFFIGLGTVYISVKQNQK